MNIFHESLGSSNCNARHASHAFTALHAERGAHMILDQFGVIDVHGDDAERFLHSQLTNNIQTLKEGSVRLAGFCSPNGRLLATLLVWRVGNTMRMLASADLIESLQKRLSMFVLRLKARLINATNNLIIVGFAGDVSASLSRCFKLLPNRVYSMVSVFSEQLIRVTDADKLSRFLWIGPNSEIKAKLSALDSIHRSQQADPILWDWLDIRAGVPRVSAATSNKFVPQMINFELIGGVDFRKGCYPGQEVIARSQYRGTIKRRTVLAHTAHAYTGAEVFHSESLSQPCGIVVNSATAPNGGMDCLVQLQLSTLGIGSIHVGSPHGPTLHITDKNILF
ncbi:YgfZ/GcvT domain-containing protein [Candidatus Vallotia lariciata]|uniref:CAF17-like 4Fe-4S cluster assembly/insertion protein YgfZ n=1 Tax=Candidatus Vallotia laricis TaxID=2018052 RepID=UPI001D0160CF|nr:folate-binding protein [Candidatus Vallotia lariciata]